MTRDAIRRFILHFSAFSCVEKAITAVMSITNSLYGSPRIHHKKEHVRLQSPLRQWHGAHLQAYPFVPLPKLQFHLLRNHPPIAPSSGELIISGNTHTPGPLRTYSEHRPQSGTCFEHTRVQQYRSPNGFKRPVGSPTQWKWDIVSRSPSGPTLMILHHYLSCCC